MKIKVNLFNPKLLKNYSVVLTIISTIFSFVSLVVEIPDDCKFFAGISLAITFVIIYILMWIFANKQTKTTLNINNSKVTIRIGDIFEENSLKVIAFNEYFDTLVDNRIIAERTLNGIFIKTKVHNIDELDNLINNDLNLNDKILDINSNRLQGKKNKYKLGSIYEYNNYLLTAFSKFDNDNRAYLNMNDYVNFLLNFWNEIDIIYANRPVSIPLLGSGMTRFKEYNLSEQELLELLIWSFKVSRIKLIHPSNVSIIIHESIQDKINFYKLSEG